MEQTPSDRPGMGPTKSTKGNRATKKTSKHVQRNGHDSLSSQIRFELNGAHSRWLEKQRELYDEHLVKILTSALREWLVRNPDRFIDRASAADVLQEALDAFILRHKDEYL
ncbi:MAG: hypothetical protein WB586_15605 [Chthoniobacterales bacterium]